MLTLTYVLMGLTILAALNVVWARSPVMSALSLMVTMFLTGLLYFSQGSYFPAVVQILIYAGAISVLFIFIVMLLDLRPSRILIPSRKVVIFFAALVGLLFGLSLLILVMPGVDRSSLVGELVSTDADNAAQFSALSVSTTLLTKYMLPFQATTLLLLAAMIGAILIGRASRKKES
jgi:NADH-quinone oxidoreductase subunit J